MRAVKTVSVGEKAVEVRELTVAEIRAWLKGLEAAAEGAEQDFVDLALFEDFRLADLVALTSLTPADMEALSPSDLRRVFDAAREVNADFFGMRARLMEMGRAALAMPAAS